MSVYRHEHIITTAEGFQVIVKIVAFSLRIFQSNQVVSAPMACGSVVLWRLCRFILHLAHHVNGFVLSTASLSIRDSIQVEPLIIFVVATIKSVGPKNKK